MPEKLFFIYNWAMIMIESELLYKDEVYAVVGAAIEVHRTLGNGFLESVYQEALQIEFQSRNIPFESQAKIQVCYKGHRLQKEFIADIVAYGQIIIELKCIPQLTNIEEAQIINYLKATGLKVGLLINFGSSIKLEWKRLVKTR